MKVPWTYRGWVNRSHVLRIKRGRIVREINFELIVPRGLMRRRNRGFFWMGDELIINNKSFAIYFKISPLDDEKSWTTKGFLGLIFELKDDSIIIFKIVSKYQLEFFS